MKKHLATSCCDLPLMMTELTVASWETIALRTMMMAQGTCGPVEYHRMVTEKMAAMQGAMTAMAKGQGHAAMLAPFVTRTRANVKRLRKQAY